MHVLMLAFTLIAKELESLPEEPDLTLPPPNEFIPTDFTLHTLEERFPLPRLLRNTDKDRVRDTKNETRKMQQKVV